MKTMGIIDEAINGIATESVSCSTILNKIGIFLEASYREYQINCQEAELKVLQESGSDEDLSFLCEAATEGFVNRAKKSIQKAVDSLMNFIKRVVEKIKNSFDNERVHAALEKVKGVVSKNPKLKNKKVKMHDVKKEQNCIQKAMDKLNSLFVKIKSGHYTKKDIDAIDETVESCKKERAKIVAATTAVGVVSAIAIYEVLVKNHKDEEAPGISSLKRAGWLNTNGEIFTTKDDTEVISALTKIKTSLAVLSKDKLNSVTSTLGHLYKSIRGSVVSENLETKTESTQEQPAGESETYTEVMYDEIFSERFNELDDTLDDTVEEAAEEIDTDELDTYIESMEQELFGDEDEEEITESTDISGLDSETFLKSLENEFQ